MEKTISILLEVDSPVEDAIRMFRFAVRSPLAVHSHLATKVPQVEGLSILKDRPPIPMFSNDLFSDMAAFITKHSMRNRSLAPWKSLHRKFNIKSETLLFSAQATPKAIEELRQRPGVKVWSDSPITPWVKKPTSPAKNRGRRAETTSSPVLTAYEASTPVRPAQRKAVIDALHVNELYRDGYRGQGIIVGILDSGICGRLYPSVRGGHSATAGGVKPGSGSASSHGSMCAGDVLTAAPQATLFDYPWSSGTPQTSEACELLQQVITDRVSGHGPHILNCSFGYASYQEKSNAPAHEVWSLDHPLNRKIIELIGTGCVVVFAAGNCGNPSPDGVCGSGCTGPGKSILGPASLPQTIAVGAVTVDRKRLPYSAQGPGGFSREKPDLCAYSHFYGHFGPNSDNPGGSAAQRCDMGTSASCPLTAGVIALLLNAKPRLAPNDVGRLLRQSATPFPQPGWGPDFGYGILDAGSAYRLLR